MSVIEANTVSSPVAFECILSASDTYIETLTIKRIEPQPWLTELVIETQLLTAKNPEEKRVKARCCIDRKRVIGLRDAVDRFLKETGAADTSAIANDTRSNPHGARAP